MEKQSGDEREKIQIEIQITEVANRFLRQHRLTTEVITHIYHSILNNNSGSFQPLETDNFPVYITDPDDEFKPELSRDKSLIWLFKKAFEEFIVGLTESIIEAHKFSKIYTLSNLTRQKSIFSKEEIDEKILQINTRPQKLPFPTLISEIENELNISIPFKSEIISINQVRNCLVHRNGLVTNKDINDEVNGSLKLSFQELIAMAEKNGQLQDIKWKDKEDGFKTNKIGFEVRPKEINFKKGEQVILNQNIFNGVSYTCILFTTNLLNILPRPIEL